MPYLRQKQAEAEEHATWLTPVEFVLDLLSRPQYAMANLGQDVSENKNIIKILEGMWKGLTGERKGDFTTTFFGGKDVGEEYEGKGWFGKQKWAKEKIPLLGDIPLVKNIAGTWEDAIGFLGNVLLDPTTYVTFGLKSGATGAGKMAARYAAKEAMKRSMFNKGNLAELAKIASKGFDVNTFKRLAQESLAKGEKYLVKHVTPKAMAQFNKRLYKQSYKEALQMTGKEFTDKMMQGLAEGSTEYMETALNRLARTGTKSLRARVNKLFKENPGNEYLQDLIKKMSKAPMPEAEIKNIYRDIIENSAEQGLQGKGLLGGIMDRYGDFVRQIDWYQSPQFASEIAKLGERKVADFFGKEIGKGIRKPNMLARTSEKIKAAVGRTPVGSFGRAVAAKMENGPVGWLRSALGIRNPYQAMLNQMKMDNHYFVDNLIRDEMNKVHNLFGAYDDATKKAARDIIDLGKKLRIKNDADLYSLPEASKIFANTDPNKVVDLINKERSLVQDWFLKEKDLYDRGLLVQFTPIANYLPHRGQVLSRKVPTRELGPFKPGFTKHQRLSLSQIAEQDVSVIKQFLGVDDATAKKIAEMGWTTANMDLEEMLLYRAHAHARAVATADLVEKFMPFGIKADVLSANQKAIRSISRAGENAFAGLREVQTEIPALKGMLFDEDVANILDRIIPIVSSDKAIAGVRKVMTYLTTMFKGYATLSPGFHLRNDRSNMFTGFLNYGAGFLNLARKGRALVVSAYGLYGDEGLRKLTKAIGLSDYKVNKILNRKAGGKTYREWAQIMKEKGVISKASMGYNLEEAIEKIGKTDPLVRRLNPFLMDNAYFKGSREVGAVIESSARVQGFIMDIEKFVGDGKATTGAIDEAVRNVKKYFFDYENLTEFEKRYLKRIIPFYSWVRKNVALQLDQLTRRTGMMETVAKTYKGLTDEDIDMADIPEWIREQVGIPFDETDEGMAKVIMPDLPIKDINKLPVRIDMEGGIPIPRVQWSGAVDEFLSMAHPVFKTIATLTGAGWDPFKKQQLDSKAPAPRAFRFLGKNPEVFAFIDAAFRAIGFKDGLGIEVDEDTGKIEMDAKAAKLLEDNFILLRRIDDMADLVTTAFPKIEEELEKLTGIKDKYDAGQKIMRTFSTFFGITQRDIDQDRQEEYRFRQALREAEAERAKERKRKPGSQYRSQKYREAYQKRLRRIRSAL